MAKTLSELAEFVGGRVVGDASCTVETVASLATANQNNISLLANDLYKKHLHTTQAGAVIISEDALSSCSTNAIVVADPYVCYAKIAALLNPPPSYPPGIEASAVVAASAQIDETAYIGANSVVGDDVVIGPDVVIGHGCVVEDGCTVGKGTRLGANVTLCSRVVIGERCLFHPGVVIGGDGFGIANDHGRWVKVPQLGSVLIGNDVEIGANTTVDRGALEDTIIEDGVKMDNMVMIAHNAKVGAHTVFVACSGVAGSTEIGKHCAIGGGVGIAGHIAIADGVQITAMSMVTKTIKSAGVYSSGVPFQTNKEWHRNAVRFKQLDEMAKRIKELERKISKLSNPE